MYGGKASAHEVCSFSRSYIFLLALVHNCWSVAFMVMVQDRILYYIATSQEAWPKVGEKWRAHLSVLSQRTIWKLPCNQLFFLYTNGQNLVTCLCLAARDTGNCVHYSWLSPPEINRWHSQRADTYSKQLNFLPPQMYVVCTLSHIKWGQPGLERTQFPWVPGCRLVVLLQLFILPTA